MTTTSTSSDYTPPPAPQAIPGTHSSLLDTEMPPGSTGTSAAPAADDSEHRSFESWDVPLTYQRTLEALTDALQPGIGMISGLEAKPGNSDSNVTSWWWGDWPNTLEVRVAPFDNHVTKVFVIRYQ